MQELYDYFDEEGSDSLIDVSLDWDDIKEDIPIDIHVDTASEGLICSLKNLGRVDIEYISKITAIKIDDVIKKLKGSIYQDPDDWEGCYYKGFKTSDEYLSGNLMQKLQRARFANMKYNNRFIDNVKALSAIMPKEIASNDIYFNLSSSWIPEHIIEDFFNDEFLFKKDSSNGLVHNQGKWEVISYRGINYSINYKFGTSRMTACRILEHLLNNSEIEIYDTFVVLDKTKRVLNKDETTLALSKAKALNDYFKEYVKRKSYLLDEIVDTYNNKFAYFNSARVYNGDFLDFKGMNPNVNLFKSQRDAVARIIFNNNTLLAYSVGAGKTYIMIAAGEELLRMKLSKKNLYVVPNNIVKQWENDYKLLYPNSNVLVLNTADFNKTKIKDTLRKMQDINNKSIIMAHFSFDNLVLSRNEEMKEISDKIYKLKMVKQTSSINTKIRNLEERYKALEALGDDYISFKELGITRLFIDEAHNYKNISIKTNRGYIKGINLDGSKKCDHLSSICKYLNSVDNSGIIMATGTPICNSISDIYSFQTYLQGGQLKLLSINSFDDWLNLFAEEKEEIEIDLDSSKCRSVKRLSKFHNLPELSKILSTFASFYYDENKEGLPKFNGYKDIMVPKSLELNNYIDDLSERLDRIRHKKYQVDLKEDNLLKIASDGRKAALDLRLIDEEKYKNSSHDKVNACALQICNMYLNSKSFKGTQLVFCDTSTPSDSFNIYDELKKALRKYGIKEEEVAYIHDAATDKAKEKLFEDMNNGIVRILIGSTQKLGVGVNVQSKLCAIHHLDIPWRPSDMVQREGRILRIGNECDEVFIFRYITEGSFDAYSWQILENKQKFIRDLLSNLLNERSKDDIDDTLLSYGKIKALAIGNSKIKERMVIQNEIDKTELLNEKYIALRTSLRRELLEIPNQINNLNDEISLIQKDIDCLKANSFSYSKEEKQNIKKEIWNKLNDSIGKETEAEILSYCGFKIKSPSYQIANKLYLILENENRYSLEIGSSEIGILSRIDNFLAKLPSKLEECISKRDNLILKKEAIVKELHDDEHDTKYVSIGLEYKNKLLKIDKELNENE